MTQLLTWEIQKALSAHLVAQNIADKRVYDMPPPAPVFPYVVLGEDQMKAWNSRTTKGYEIYVLLHVFSKNEGRAEVKQLSEDIRTSLAPEQLILKDFKIVQLEVEAIQTTRDPKTKTCQAIIKVAMLGVNTGEDA